MANAIMIQGTASNAGKSLLAAGLCRIFAQDGYKVAPFKSQNMALNSAITPDGFEMGRAQVVQAEAAGVAPDVRMNPILLKPTSHVGSQVIVNGVPRGTMPAGEYFRYRKSLIPEVMAAYESLAAEYDIIVIEGAGSPAEINLRQDDIVNMGMARRANAPVLLCGDIDRGGVFASLYGTVKLLEPDEQARIKGLIINKFRGDVDILRPGLGELERLSGKPVLGVVPMLDVDVDDEDSLSHRLSGGGRVGLVDIAVVRLPRLSNFTDFNPLERMEEVTLRYVRNPRELGERVFPAEQLPVVKRVIHTTADFEYADNLVFSAGAVEAGIAAIRQGCTIVTDTQMAFSGVNKRVLEKFGGRAVCFMSDPDVAAEAKARGETRATVSMERAARLEGPLVLAIGNAPTALVRACELIGAGELKPALVIGVPVGFVNVVESKELLLTLDVSHIVARGRKGGSNVAAAICNAMLYQASNNARE